MGNIPKLLIGTYQNNNYKDVFAVVKTSVESGFYGFDTAPSYGSEKQLGKALNECRQVYGLNRESFFISTKIDAWQMQAKHGDVAQYVKSALLSMNLDYVDLLLIHWPIDMYIEDTWKNLEILQMEKLATNIGICNIRVRHLVEYKELGINPHYVQIERHPLRVCHSEMEYCKKNNITVFSYSPLCRMHSAIRNNNSLKTLAEKYNKDIGQIVLRWHIETGSIPVFMSKNTSRIKENIDIFDFSLTNEDIELIYSMNRNYKIFLESWGCPGF